LQRRVDAGELPGAVFMAVRNGKIAVHQAVGFQDKSAKTPMSPDSIFRIASMTKPIVSTAIMMLAEQGKLYVSDPLSKHIPEFANSKVLVEKILLMGSPNLHWSQHAAKSQFRTSFDTHRV